MGAYWRNKFDTAEVKLLIGAVQSSWFITLQKSKALIRKLGVFIEPQQKQLLKRQLYIDHRTKATNESVILIVDHLHTAILERKKVTFQYCDYTPEKKKVHRHNGQLYTVSPCAMLWNNDQYYMEDYFEEWKLVATYRVDRINLWAITSMAECLPLEERCGYSARKRSGCNLTGFRAISRHEKNNGAWIFHAPLLVSRRCMSKIWKFVFSAK